MSLAKFIWGGDRLDRRHEILKALSQFPLTTKCSNPYALSRRDLWALRIQQGVELLELKMKLGWTSQHFLDALKIACPDVASLGVNYRIFIKNLEAQMSPEQRAYWVPRARNFEISGCYAQTELGHGSNVRGIETTATFDPDTDEIVINSPTISSHKYWIGSLGVVATHALVVARLIVHGKNLGNHVFLVQVRDLQTHDLVPNVLIYEQGEKSLGTFASMDNGTMQFKNKRIPRSHMLSGMASLDRDGTYHRGKNEKHSYTSMVIIRGLMSEEIGQDVSKAVVIALEYAKFRRQFNARNGEETRVIEYASVRNRLYPALCRAIAMMLLGREIRDQVDNIHQANLEDLHLSTVGAKIWVTEHGVRDVEVARLSCGGHGNMAQTGLGAIYAQLSPSRTYEGDTYVLSQQIGNAVVKHWKNHTEASISALSYLSRLRDDQKMARRAKIASIDAWLGLGAQEDFLEHRASVLARRHLHDTTEGRDTSYDVLQLTMAHADLTYWRGLQSQIRHVPSQHKEIITGLANVVRIVSTLKTDGLTQKFSLTTMLEGLDAFVGSNYLSESDISTLRIAHQTAISSFGQYVDVIVDALGFTESELNSVFARKDQTPYEALWESAKQSELSDNAFIRPILLHARGIWKKHQADRARL